MASMFWAPFASEKHPVDDERSLSLGESYDSLHHLLC